MKDFFITTISSAISMIVTFILTRRKYNAEVRKATAESASNEIENLDKATQMWRETAETLRATLSAEIIQLRKENQSTRDKLNALKIENDSLRRQMTSLERTLNETRLENQKLSAKIMEFNSHFIK